MPAVIMLLCLVVACDRGKASAPSEEVARKAPIPSTSGPWTRAEWLAAADGFVSDPETMPRLGDPATRPLFEKLVTTEAWLRVDRTAFERSGEEIIRFFPAFKKLTLVLASRAAVDEMVVLGAYALDVYRAIIEAGADFVAHLPPDGTDHQTRRGGLEKMRLGAALEVCALLYLAMDAADDRRHAVIAKLSSPRSYTFHSREGLQLIMATLDEKLLPKIRPDLRQSYWTIRQVVAREHDSSPATTPSIRTTYQGVGPPTPDLTRPVRFVSTTGGFSVELGPAALTKRVEITRPDGTTTVQHWIELQDGETMFESACFDGTSEAELAAKLLAADGVQPRSALQPGTWFTVNRNGRQGRIRLLTISRRGCMASVEGPGAQFSGARAEAFLASLEPAP